MRPRPALIYCATATIVIAITALGWAARSATASRPVAQWGATEDSAESTPATAVQPAPTATSTTPSTTATTKPLVHANPVTLNAPGFWSWALLDQASGTVVGSPNDNATQVTASMIKSWLASDYLRLAAAKGSQPSKAALQQLSIMIRDSDNNAASATYISVGKAASITRLIKICGLTDSKAGADWAHTLVSARDAIRMGQCIATGQAAGAKWTDWVLNEMRSVRGAGLFGPIEVLPAAEAKQTAIKNGWVSLKDGNWHVNCLAIGQGWVLAVESVYPVAKGMGIGTANCRSVTQQLMANAS